MSGLNEQPAILYSFRRCPYAIRARLALAAAGVQPSRDLDVREVALRAKPPELLTASGKGTVPVLVLPGNTAEGSRIVDESRAIMHWALDLTDPEGWWHGRTAAEQAVIDALITRNDGPFKHHLDRFKYAGRFGASGLEQQQHHRQKALAILRDWNGQLERGGWLLGSEPCLADWALLPFVRQFCLANPVGFDNEADLDALQRWLARFVSGPELAQVMTDPWAARSPWRSPSWLYHLALKADWQAARAARTDYRISTRGRTLAEVGFIHLCHADQVDATAARFYSDLSDQDLVLLHIDPAKLSAAGLRVIQEPALVQNHGIEAQELFPHLYGHLPLESIVTSQTFERHSLSNNI